MALSDCDGAPLLQTPSRGHSQLVSILNLPVDRPLRLVRIAGGRQLKQRLLALGLSEGSEVRVVQRRPGGVVLARAGTRVAVGQGVAHQLMAEVIER